MTRLQKILEKRADTLERTNIVIIPGNNGETLADQTCSHFPTWLDEIVASKNKSTVVWIFRHEIRIDNLASWFSYCEAGEHLLQNLTNMQKDDGLSDDDTLILIGHKLGSFMLKKALLEAHRSSHHPHMDALLNTIETLIMLGDPDLNPDNQNEWIPLISKCLPCKTLPKHLNCPQDARCLQHVSGCFEEFTLQSTLFQVSSTAESKRKHFLKFLAEDHRCIVSGTLTVRMWTTTAEEYTIANGDGDKKNCAFYPKSTLYPWLLSMPFAAQPSISGTTAQLSVLEAQTSDDPTTCITMGETATDLACNGPASSQATFLTMHPTPPIDTIPVTTKGSACGSDNVSAGGVKDEASPESHNNQDPDLRRRPPEPLAAKASIESEYDIGTKSLEAITIEQARHEDSAKNVLQQNSLESLSALDSSRVARRSPFLFTRVPSRDARFFGREELLIPLERVLTPVSALPSGHLASLDSGAVVVLHGDPGVGKSAIALELTYRIQATFDLVFWLRADSNLHLAQSCHEAAVGLGLVQDRKDHNHESSRQKLLAWLSTTSSRWLLVFDDADDFQNLSNFMPNRARGSIIVTSRQRFRKGPEVEEDECLHNFQVGPFAVEDATEFIRSLAPCAFDASDPATDLATLTTIAEDCLCLPLALRRVGTILNRRGSSKDKRIMAVLEQHAGRVLASQPFSPLIYANLSSASLALANVITFLDPYYIDNAILLGAQRYKDVPLSAFPMNDHDYFNAKNELIAHALLARGVDPSALDIHRVTARSLRAMLDPDNFRQGFHCASRLLEARWPSRRKMKNIVLGNWPEFDALHSHVHQLSSIFVEYDQKRQNGKLKQELSNDSYLKILLQSTWYNAYRGNAEEDQGLIRLAHGLIARSQRPDPSLLQTETSSTELPARLIDVGQDNTQSPRLVDTAGQVGCYAALSYCWGSQISSETQLTKSNMRRLQRSIENSEIPRCVFDAVELTRSLGLRYIWIDSLCVVQDDQEELLNTISMMSDIYRSAILTIAAVGTNGETIDSYIDSSLLKQPLSIFLDWSRPTVAKSFSHRLFTPNAFSRRWIVYEDAVLDVRHKDIKATDLSIGQSGSVIFTDFGVSKRFPEDKSHVTNDEWKIGCSNIFSLGCIFLEMVTLLQENTLNLDRKDDVEAVNPQVETFETRFEEANCEIDQGVQYVEAGKNFEALALFMKARELVSAFQTLTLRSWKIHAAASAYIALVYQTQNLPVMALDIVEASLAVQTKVANTDCSSSFEQIRLHFVRGSIYNALEKPDESLSCYKIANKDLERLPGEEHLSESADWKGVLNLKLAEHQMRMKDYKEAHALLQQSLDHFQSQESFSAQAHLARTLHWQSVVYEAQGSKTMGNAIKAAARQTWNGVREARGRAVSEGIDSLKTDDFDGEVEFWYR